MTQRSLLPVMAFLGQVMLTVTQAQAETSATVDFNRDIRPIFSRNCFPCHGQDAAHRATKMRLDRRESAVKMQKDGNTPIVPGSPQQSELYRRITAKDEDERMPPKESGHHLTPTQIETLRRWMPAQYALAEVVGKWIWIKFEEAPTERVRADLSQLGFHWNNTRKCWQHPCGETLPRGQQEPREKYSVWFPSAIEALRQKKAQQGQTASVANTLEQAAA